MTGPLPRASLAAIITSARAGSLGHAWALFEAGGWADRGDDPAALGIKARLLKERALRATGSERQGLLEASAQAYARANLLRPQPHIAINEATLRLLAGDPAAARRMAQALLDWLARAGDLAETAYFIEATRAEAHLLCGDVPGATAAMARACAASPDGWADRAASLHQFALILAATGQDAGWLDAFRPPLSLNFAGHLGVSPEGAVGLRAQVDGWLDGANIGFGYGALAAGADIVVAEALLARGGELHVILPTSLEAFVAQSVTPYHPDWRGRFEACLAAAHSLRCVTKLEGAYEPLATRLAADVAMGATVLNASMLESRAAQLLIIDEAPGRFGAGLGTTYIGERWQEAGPQHCIAAPRSAPVLASGQKAQREGRADRRLAAMLMIAFAGLDHADETGFAEALDTVIGDFRRACAALPIRPDLILPMGNARLVAFADPDQAWRYARALLAMPLGLPLRVAGHYALAHWLDDPAALVGRGVAELGVMAAHALPGVLTASETLACALQVNPAARIIAEHVGEAGELRLFALTPRDQ